MSRFTYKNKIIGKSKLIFKIKFNQEKSKSKDKVKSEELKKK